MEDDFGKRTEDKRMIDILASAMREVFGEHEGSKRFIDVSRIPLICKSIGDISTNIEAIQKKINNDSQEIVRLKLWKATLIGGQAVLIGVIATMGWLVMKNISTYQENFNLIIDKKISNAINCNNQLFFENIKTPCQH